MARFNLSLALGLTLFTFCLLALTREARARPGEVLLGGRKDLQPSDPQVMKAAQAAVASYNMGSNSLYYFRDTRILKAQSQVRLGWRDRGEGGMQRGARLRGSHKSNQGILTQYFKIELMQKFTMN